MTIKYSYLPLSGKIVELSEPTEHSNELYKKFYESVKLFDSKQEVQDYLTELRIENAKMGVGNPK